MEHRYGQPDVWVLDAARVAPPSGFRFDLRETAIRSEYPGHGLAQDFQTLLLAAHLAGRRLLERMRIGIRFG